MLWKKNRKERQLNTDTDSTITVFDYGILVVIGLNLEQWKWLRNWNVYQHSHFMIRLHNTCIFWITQNRIDDWNVWTSSLFVPLFRYLAPIQIRMQRKYFHCGSFIFRYHVNHACLQRRVVLDGAAAEDQAPPMHEDAISWTRFEYYWPVTGGVPLQRANDVNLSYCVHQQCEQTAQQPGEFPVNNDEILFLSLEWRTPWLLN